MLPEDDSGLKFGRSLADLDARESSLERRACTYAKGLSYWTRKFKSPGKRSAPDRIFASKSGFVMFVEFKARNKKPTDLQLAEHADMRDHGLVVYVVDSYEQATQILDRHCL